MADPRQPASDRPLFRPRHRLSRATDFQAAYCRGCRAAAGPLAVFVRPNGLPEHRLGLSVGRRVGGAVVRNRIKRLLREAFRHVRSTLPRPQTGAYDIVVTVRPHRPMPLAAYTSRLVELVARAHRRTQAETHTGDAT